MGITTKTFDKSRMKPVVMKATNKKRLFMTRAEAQAENDKLKNIADKVEAFRKQLEEQEKKDGVFIEEVKEQEQKEVVQAPAVDNPIIKRKGRPAKLKTKSE